MTKKLTMGMISLFLMTGLAMPQQTVKTTHKKTRTLTGCLGKAEGGGEYQLTTRTGSTWELKSDSVKLDEHVGHIVKLKGVVSNAKLHGMKEDVKGEMHEHGVDKGAREHGHMTVTDLNMVSSTCRK
jgi:hypothetical protein